MQDRYSSGGKLHFDRIAAGRVKIYSYGFT